MVKKTLFLLLFPLIAQLVISCCDCPEPVIRYYTNKSITARHLDNRGAQVEVATSGSIPKKAYGIRLQLTREITACIQKSNSLFISSAYAFGCHCMPALQFWAKDSIKTIKIFTLRDFDNTHFAGADLSDYFQVFTANTFTSITDYLKHPEAVLYTETELTNSTNLLLMTAPSTHTQHQFRLQMTLSDGRVLETETSTIELI